MFNYEKVADPLFCTCVIEMPFIVNSYYYTLSWSGTVRKSLKFQSWTQKNAIPQILELYCIEISPMELWIVWALCINEAVSKKEACKFERRNKMVLQKKWNVVKQKAWWTQVRGGCRYVKPISHLQCSAKLNGWITWKLIIEKPLKNGTQIKRIGFDLCLKWSCQVWKPWWAGKNRWI